MVTLPSKKITAIGIICLAGVLAVFVYSQKGKRAAQPLAHSGNRTPYAQEVSTLIENDQDGDGLKDWEEVLWKTNPGEKDTDKDGDSDSEEITVRRDPTRPGPDDAIVEKGAFSENVSSTTENLTVTERLGREFFASYLAARQSGEPITAQSMQESIRSLVENAGSVETARKYSVVDIQTTLQEGRAAIRAYGNAMGEIVIRYSPKDLDKQENEFVLFSRVIKSQDYAELKKLDPTIEGYARITREALALPAPQRLAPLHLSLINAMSNFKETVAGMRGAENDPVLALVAMGNYKKHLTALYDAIIAIGRYFEKQGVRFGAKEGGAIFKPL